MTTAKGFQLVYTTTATDQGAFNIGKINIFILGYLKNAN